MSDEPKLPPDPSSAEPPSPPSDGPPEAPVEMPHEPDSMLAASAAPEEPAPANPDDVPEWLVRIRARREAEQARSRSAQPPGTEAPRPAPRQAPPKQASPRQAPPRQTPAGSAESPRPRPQGTPAPGAPRSGNGGLPAAPEQPASTPGEAAPAAPSTAPSAPAPDEPPAWLTAAPAAANRAPRPDDPPWVQAAAEAAARDGRAAVPAAPDLREAPIEAPHDGPAAAPADLEAAARVARRERMAERRRERRRRQRGAVSTLQSVIIVGAAAVMIATIFTFWTPASFLSDETREGLRPAYATLNAQSVPTPIPTPVWLRRVGIVSGHWGPHPDTGRSDPGAVCPDGLTEAEINRNVAQRVVQALSGRGYQVDLLDEWDPRLKDYEAAAIISIHADSCHQFDLPGATGFKVAPPSARVTVRADDLRLVDCLIQNYGEITGLPQHPSITRDMTEYHGFGEISSITPGAIIEIGFLYEDRQILTEQPDLLAQGIVSGLLCFLEATPPTPLPELTPWPTAIATPTPLEAPGLS